MYCYKLGYRASQGSLLNQIPLKSDALFWLDGVIVDDGGTKYFRDKSGNNRRFLITGYDFDTTWVAGMPYKSAATISAPAADAALIAADINNYLYDSGGNPNQIPVVSLFQDVDYEHKLFCRHIAQELDINGVETSEPRVVDIVLYANVKTGADLTICQNYFNVPVEATSNVIWVSKTGNDSTGNGSKASPYLTIDKAYNSGNGNTVYVKSGTYVENSYGLGYLYLDTESDVFGLGNVKIKSTDNSWVVRIIMSDNKTVSLSNVIVDAENRAVKGIETYSTIVDVVLNSVAFVNVKTLALYHTATSNIVFNYCTGGIKLISGVGISVFDTCNIQGGISFSNNCEIYNCRILSNTDNEVAVANSGAGLILKGNTISAKGKCVQLLSTEMVASKDVIVFGNTMRIFDLSSSGNVYGIYVGGGGSKYNIDIQHNVFFQSETGALNATGACIYVIDQIQPNISNNVFDIKAETLMDAIVHFFTGGVVSGKNTINNNRIDTMSLTGVVLTIGYEEGHSGICDNSEIIGNYIRGYKYLSPSTTGTTHGILVNCGINCDIKYNYIGFVSVGIAVKTGIQDSYTANGVTYNILEDNKSNIWIRGVSGINVFNNLILESETEYTDTFWGGIIADENTALAGTQYSSNIISKNNIIDIKKSVGNLYVFDINSVVGSVITHGIARGGEYKIAGGGTNYTTLAAAQLDGWMDECSDSDPNISEYVPFVAINGVDLGDSYNIGISSESSITLGGFVSTRVQPTVWQQGAVIK